MVHLSFLVFFLSICQVIIKLMDTLRKIEKLFKKFGKKIEET